MNMILSKINREVVLVYFLAFVLFYFGINEVSSPQDWTPLVPAFLGSGGVAVYMVVFHGILLLLSGLAMIFNFHRRVVAFVVALMLLDIVGILIMSGGLNEVAVRDIGLLGMAIALSLRN